MMEMGTGMGMGIVSGNKNGIGNRSGNGNGNEISTIFLYNLSPCYVLNLHVPCKRYDDIYVDIKKITLEKQNEKT
jgi:hypothetical protein